MSDLALRFLHDVNSTDGSDGAHAGNAIFGVLEIGQTPEEQDPDDLAALDRLLRQYAAELSRSEPEPMPDALRAELGRRGIDPDAVREWTQGGDGRYVVRMSPFANVVNVVARLTL